MQRPELQRFSEPLILLLLAAVCYVFFFYGISAIGLTGPDEPRYAAVAREMYQSGDWVTPRLHGEPWFEKPVLLYWGAALGFVLFGVGEFGARLPSALGATATVFALYFVCRRLWGKAAAVWASLILCSSVGYFAFGRAASTDMPLTACLTLALLAFLMGHDAEEPYRRRWFRAFYAFLGLGVLAKGPVAVLLPVLALLAYLVSRRRLSDWKSWHPEDAWIILLVSAPWYVAVTWANGYEFVRVFFIDQNLQRFTSTIHGHERPFYFYIPALMMLTFPWTFVVLPALRRRLPDKERILLWWVVAPVLFFSLSGSKLPGYILPSVPPFVMLIARAISGGTSRSFRIATFIEAGLMLFIGVAFGFFGNMLSVDAHVDGFVIFGVTLALALVLAGIALWLRPADSETMRPWFGTLARLVPAEETVFLYRPSRWMEYGLQFYRFNRTQGVYSPEELQDVLKQHPKPFFVAADKDLATLADVGGIEIKVAETVGSQSAFWVWESVASPTP
jgi:4-amino-4-deoxy-L-arabinose transferase-like glycosyltransferase